MVVGEVGRERGEDGDSYRLTTLERRVKDDRGIKALASVSGIGEYVFDGMVGKLNVKPLIFVLVIAFREQWEKGRKEEQISARKQRNKQLDATK